MKRFLLFALVATMFASCMNDLFDQNGGSDKMPITISVEQTRANDVSFESGDQLGLYVVNYENGSAGTLASNGNHVDNMRFTLSSTWTPDEEIYWKDKTTKADFYAYYPYGYPSNVSAYPFSVNEDQSSEANYWASDFLWGKRSGISPSNNAVPIQTQHLFSNAIIYIVAGEGITAEELAAANIEVKIRNVKTSAVIDLATGNLSPTGNTSEITPWYTGEYYRAMIVPQAVSSNSQLLSVKINGVAYSHSTDIQFRPNTCHQITVTVNAEGLPSNDKFQLTFSIKEWEYDSVDHGGELVKEEENKYTDFQVIFDKSTLTCGYAQYSWTTTVDANTKYVMLTNQDLDAFGIMGETTTERLTNYISTLANYGMLTEEFATSGYWYKGAPEEGVVRDAYRYSAEENVEVYAAAFTAYSTGQFDEYGMEIYSTNLTTSVHVWKVPFLPYPNVVFAEADMTKNVTSAAGSVTIDCVVENPIEGETVICQTESAWVTPTWANNKLTLTYTANEAAVARRARVVVQYGYYTNPFEVILVQEKDANAVAVTLDVKVTGTTFNGIWVNVTPSDPKVTYALSTETPEKNWETGAEIEKDWMSVAENLLSYTGSATFHTGNLTNYFIKMNPSNYEWYGKDYYVWAVAVDATSEEGTDYYGNPKTTWTVNQLLSEVYYDRVTIDDSAMPAVAWDAERSGLVWNENYERYEIEVVEGTTLTLHFTVTNPVEGAFLALNGTTLYDSYNVVDGEPVIDNAAGTITFKIDAFDTAKRYHYVSPNFRYTNADGDNLGAFTPTLRITQTQK